MFTFWIFFCRLVRKILTEKEFKATMTIFLVCFAFFVCVTPFMICHFLSDFGISFQVGTFCTCLYWLQYCINFFIYILRSEQYSKAYLILFRKVNCIFFFFFQIFFSKIVNFSGEAFNRWNHSDK